MLKRIFAPLFMPVPDTDNQHIPILFNQIDNEVRAIRINPDRRGYFFPLTGHFRVFGQEGEHLRQPKMVPFGLLDSEQTCPILKNSDDIVSRLPGQPKKH